MPATAVMRLDDCANLERKEVGASATTIVARVTFAALAKHAPMSVLTLAVAAPERDRLVEADDAIGETMRSIMVQGQRTASANLPPRPAVEPFSP